MSFEPPEFSHRPARGLRILSRRIAELWAAHCDKQLKPEQAAILELLDRIEALTGQLAETNERLAALEGEKNK